MKYFLILLLPLLLFLPKKLNAQDSEEEFIKSKGFVVNSYIGYNKSSNGAYLTRNGSRDRFGPDENNNSCRFLVESSVLVNYFLWPKHLSIGLGLGISKSYKPNFVQIPFIFDLRGYIFQDYDALMLFVQYAHSPFINKNIITGYSFEMGVGYQFRLLEEYFLVELGFKGRMLSFVDEQILRTSNGARLSGFCLKIGYQF